jgi:phage tail-like protein
MDANGTRYHLLLGEADWSRCTDGQAPVRAVTAAALRSDVVSGLAWNTERAELTLHPRLFQFIAAPKDKPPSLDTRRGAGRDRYGNWYWIDAGGDKVRVKSQGTGNVSDFWPNPNMCENEETGRRGDFQPYDNRPPQPSKFRGLAVTLDHFLAVGVLEPAGLLVFDLHAGGSPRRLVWPEEVEFAPFDIAPAPCGGVWILDHDHARYWGLDRNFNVIRLGQHETVMKPGGRDDFQPQDGGSVRWSEPQAFPQGISLIDSSPLAAHDPIAIEALPDGTVLILDRNPDPQARHQFSLVYRYRMQEQLGPPAPTQVMGGLIENEQSDDFNLVGYDFTFVPEHQLDDESRVLDRLYIVAEKGNQTFAFNLSGTDEQLSMEPLPDYLPMRLFGGKGLVAVGDEAYYDFGDNWIPLIEQRRPRYAQEATLLTPLNEEGFANDDADEQEQEQPHAFDGREPDCVWHRLLLDACIPPETEVLVWSRAANNERELALARWQPEPRLYLRGKGSELPYVSRKSSEEDGTWELLFQNARGRFLQLKLELRGNGRTTPRLRALRAYYPRFSYLDQYLPAVYREDALSASFLDRFLANMEGLYTSIEDRIAAAQMLFDVRSAPTETLQWLAGWFGVTLDPTWDDARRRLFIKHALLFFQYRGTIRGLQWALRLALDECADETIFTDEQPSRTSRIRVVEKFLKRRAPAIVFGDPTEQQQQQARGPQLIQQMARWQPAQGDAELHRRWDQTLREALGPKLKQSKLRLYPINPPEWADNAALWRQFSLDTFGFIPSATDEERRRWQNFLARKYLTVRALNRAHQSQWTNFARVPLPFDATSRAALFEDWKEFAQKVAPASSAPLRKWWQDFLARRYRRINSFNETYGTRWPAFEMISLPGSLPRNGGPLQDWYLFEAIVVPMQQSAHRFTVLLPVPKAMTSGAATYQERLDLARRIINLEKPAHTIFDIKFYWALFRTGEARLGLDTLLDLGSRAPQLMSPMILGQGHLAETYIAPTHPQDVADRQTLGFTRLSDRSI